eukprot:jgi/Chrzof1/2030/UNPLg00685.t1
MQMPKADFHKECLAIQQPLPNDSSPPAALHCRPRSPPPENSHQAATPWNTKEQERTQTKHSHTLADPDTSNRGHGQHPDGTRPSPMIKAQHMRSLLKYGLHSVRPALPESRSFQMVLEVPRCF